MNFIMISIFVTLSILIAAFIGYSLTTSNIIRDQEKQIAKLRTENFRLQAKLKRQDSMYIKSGAHVIELHDNRVDPENIPEFNNI